MCQNNFMEKKIIRWIGVILWMGVIYYFSDQPDLKSSLPSMWDFIFRKIAHVSEYFVLSYLIFLATRDSFRLSEIKIFFVSFMFPFVYALFDEFHQTFIFKRHGSLLDVGVDLIGIIFFIILLRKHKRRYL